ncbi:DNA primase large subunit [Pyrus ussuriensis x Pyrus communis]|uniref:DNA primase large subunit n=1 Tax=Pyrus ussuriensis x Pyrus communis TaxID=2448454 RepID=A0A5N5HBH7_9ROSA|nr:DNA primase large subunit [Pyrus ussuriensis x Pyrus communis]
MQVVRSQTKSFIKDVVPTLPLYRSAPALEVRLEEFELFALDRLRVLKGISDGLSRGKKPDEMQKLAIELWKTNMRHPQASEVVNKGIISHFVLRLVYCRTEDLRKWFLSMETALFRYRFMNEQPEPQRALMEEFDLPYKAVSGSELEVIIVSDKLVPVSRSLGAQSPPTVFPFTFSFAASDIFFKLPFEEVPELVASRRVVSLVATQFRSLLSKALILTNRLLKWTTTIAEQEKDRLTPIVVALSSSYLGPDHSEDHHLKHGGRMQLGLFLKGVGLKLDDALAFWKAEFSQKVGAERFDKEYSYGIHHNYGREGNRMDYTPYSCQKIISSTPGVGDHHGCPYRYFSEENLRAALGKMGVTGRAVGDVMDKAKNRHYQLACTLTFEAIHGSSCDAGINHPNQYFNDSQIIIKSKNQSTA